MNKLMIDMIHSMIQSYQSEAEKRMEVARNQIDNGSKENYTSNMTAALVLQGLARAHIAMLQELERSLK
jgi:hypothetical protein